MAPEWIYLLKVNVGIALFYAFYKLFCCNDTFFRWRRFALLGMLAISFLYPIVDIQEWVKEQPVMTDLSDYYTNWVLLEEITVTPTIFAVQIPDLTTVCKYIYLLGVIVLSVRFFIQLCSILRLRWKGKVTYIQGQRIICMPTETNPFSFFHWIFIHLQGSYNESMDEIIMHEQTHVKQWHSIDVVISEIINIICWFNPFMWLLKNEIRLNLEYLADNKVTEVILDTKVYQYHLLGLASQKRETGLYNNFNVSHLKHRIIMMNKKRTRAVGHLKYVLFAPLAFALLLVSNISCVSTEEEKALEVCEQMPEYPGGMPELMKFLSKNVLYPVQAQENNIQGRVIVQFVVKKDGSVSDVKVAKGVDPLLDKEALRVVNSMPKWKPGMQEGKTVNVKYTIPVLFKLQSAEEAQREAQVDENGVYMVCDEMPNFPGGMQECMKFLRKNIAYPAISQENGVQGRVIVQFVVKEDGSIEEAKVVRGVDPLLDKEALRVINAMPKWIPGKKDGKAVNVKYTIPVAFKLQ